MLQKIDERYQDLHDDILDATTIGSLKNWPSENDEAYGVQHVKVLSERFKKTLHDAGVDGKKLLEEWQMLKCLISRRFKKNFRASTWKDIHAVFGDSGVTNILSLLDLVHSLPPTSVLNETGFNQMKLIKTDRQHSLSGHHLNDLMIIRLQSPSVTEFDPTPAIDKWMISPTRQRRFHHRRNPTKKKPITDDADEIEIVNESEYQRESDNESPRAVLDQRQSVRDGIRVGERMDNEESECESECEQDFDENERMVREVVRELEIEFENF